MTVFYEMKTKCMTCKKKKNLSIYINILIYFESLDTSRSSSGFRLTQA